MTVATVKSQIVGSQSLLGNGYRDLLIKQLTIKVLK
jgi:hypothetical protein